MWSTRGRPDSKGEEESKGVEESDTTGLGKRTSLN